PLHPLASSLPRPPRPTLFPYTTLFRSAFSVSKIRFVVIISRFHSGEDVNMSQSSQLIETARRTIGMEIEAVEQLKARIDEQFVQDRKSTRLNSSHVKISYAVFCLKKTT